MIKLYMRNNNADPFIYELVSIENDIVKLIILKNNDGKIMRIPTATRLNFFNKNFKKIEKESDLYITKYVRYNE